MPPPLLETMTKVNMPDLQNHFALSKFRFTIGSLSYHYPFSLHSNK